MRGRRRMCDRGLHVSKIGGNRQHSGGIDYAPGAFAPATDNERYDTAKAALLRLRQPMLGMRFEPGIVDLLDRRMIG